MINWNIVSPEDFNEFFEKGLTFNNYLNKIEKEENKKRHEIYYRRAKIDEELKTQLSELTWQIKIVVIAADWCWDCQTNVPVIAKLSEFSDKIDIRFFKKEDFSDYLLKTNGGEKVPFVMIFSKDGHFINSWVEKSSLAYKLYADIRKELGWQIEKGKFYREYRQRFLKMQKDLNRATIEELIDILIKSEYIMRGSPRLNKK